MVLKTNVDDVIIDRAFALLTDLLLSLLTH